MELNLTMRIEDRTTGSFPKIQAKILDYLGFLFGEPEALKAVLARTNWWLVGLWLGLVAAVSRLILISNPGICYLLAKDQVRGFEVTLPEAMAAVKVWGWLNLVLSPLLCLMLLAALAWLMSRITWRFKGSGVFRVYFGMVTSCALLILLGRITGYIIVNGQDLKSISDLRDLTPGVGLALLPLLALERIGPFGWELARGFDLFGIWVVLLLAMLFQYCEDFSKGKSFLLAGIYYSLFIAARWVVEGPGHQLWYYFWNAGNY